MFRFVSVLLFLGVCLASLWNSAERNPAPKLAFGSYQVSLLRYGVVITNPHRPGAFFSVLGYDEIAFTKGGQEVRLGGFDPKTVREKPWDNLRALFLPAPLAVLFTSPQGLIETEYLISSNGIQGIEIKRTLQSQEELLGLQKGFIFNPDDEILLNGQPVVRPKNADTIERTGVTEVIIKSLRLPQALKIETDSTSTVTVDFAFHIVKEKTLFNLPTKIFEQAQKITAQDF
ncbi:MAG: hypothetical protein Q8L46_01340 [candidate division WWE3 bacterium]|nr:hypothetical protein [candidate division WWE3 bacterium]